MTTTTQTTTIREFLESLGGVDHVDNQAGPDALNLEVRAFFMSSPESNAILQVRCGGDCIIGFKPTKQHRRNLYIVRDDNPGKTWDARRAMLPENERFHYPSQAGPRPHASLKLVQSG